MGGGKADRRCVRSVARMDWNVLVHVCDMVLG